MYQKNILEPNFICVNRTEGQQENTKSWTICGWYEFCLFISNKKIK